MPQTYTIGKTAPTPRGAYNGTTQYYQLDIVSNNGSSYIVLQDCIGIAPPNSAYYMQIASKGDTGDNGQSPTIAVGNVSSGETPSVTNVGTAVNAVFDFVLPIDVSGQFVVTFTSTSIGGTLVWSADQSLSDILNALNSGRRVAGIYRDLAQGDTPCLVFEVKWYRDSVGEECVYFEYIDFDSFSVETEGVSQQAHVRRLFYHNDGIVYINSTYFWTLK